jgi:hypothetical protein
MVGIVTNEELSLSLLESSESSLSSHEKKLKNKENIFFKMCFLKIKRTDHFIVKQLGTKMYFTNKFESTTYITYIFHSSPLYFNSILPKTNSIEC